MDRLQELKHEYLQAEQRHRDAYRRAVWLEKNLYNATTEDCFQSRLAELNEQERLLHELGLIAMNARSQYAAADMTAMKGAAL